MNQTWTNKNINKTQSMSVSFTKALNIIIMLIVGIIILTGVPFIIKKIAEVVAAIKTAKETADAAANVQHAANHEDVQQDTVVNQNDLRHELSYYTAVADAQEALMSNNNPLWGKTDGEIIYRPLAGKYSKPELKAIYAQFGNRMDLNHWGKFSLFEWYNNRLDKDSIGYKQLKTMWKNAGYNF